MKANNLNPEHEAKDKRSEPLTLRFAPRKQQNINL
jgi:hypothetical protein